MGVCNCSVFCSTLLYVYSSIAIILMGKRELVALFNLPPWCFVMAEWLFLAVPRGCLRFVIVVFPDHTHLLFFYHSELKTFKMADLEMQKLDSLYQKTSCRNVVFVITRSGRSLACCVIC